VGGAGQVAMEERLFEVLCGHRGGACAAFERGMVAFESHVCMLAWIL